MALNTNHRASKALKQIERHLLESLLLADKLEKKKKRLGMAEAENCGLSSVKNIKK
jgi:hypothetical protein